MKKALILTIGLIAGAAVQASLKDATKVLTVGNWTVLREVDKMTDKISCTGIYKQDYGKQLARDGLYITIRGGISSVTLRFDDQPARQLRIPTKMEKDIRAVMLEGEEFAAALASSRLRGQALTLVSGLQEFELDLSGIAEAVASIRSDCPPPAAIASEPAPSVPVVAPAEAPALCSAVLLERMKTAKLAPLQIQRICDSPKP